MHALAACLLAPALLAGEAFGEAVAFGPAFARFTVEVPEGWTAEPTPAGAAIAHPSGEALLQVVAFRTGAMPPVQVARAYAGLAGTGEPEAVDFQSFVLMGPGGARTLLRVAGGCCLAAAASGDAPELDAMARSVRRLP